MADAFVAVLRIDLHFPDAGSLKAKRSELNAVKAGLHQRFGAAVAEVAHQDTWQRSTLLASLCAGAEGRVGDARGQPVPVAGRALPVGRPGRPANRLLEPTWRY